MRMSDRMDRSRRKDDDIVTYRGRRYFDDGTFTIIRDTLEALEGCYRTLSEGPLFPEDYQQDHEIYNKISEVCRRFEDADIPLLSDTQIHMWKLSDLATTEPEVEGRKEWYMMQEIRLTVDLLKEELEHFRYRNVLFRASYRIYHLIRPRVIDMDMGRRCRPNLTSRMALRSAERKMRKERL